MTDRLEAIGVLIEDEDVYSDIARLILSSGTRFDARGGEYRRLAHESDAEVWAWQGAGGGFEGLMPHFRGDGVMRVRLTDQLSTPAGHEGHMGGLILGDVASADGESFPLSFESPCPGLFDALPVPGDVSIQLAAFTDDVSCHRDERAYYEHREDVVFSSRSYIPMGLFGDGPHSAHARLTGHIIRAEERLGPLGGRFWWLLVETLGGTVDVVAASADVSDEPRVGGVLSAVCWMSGILTVADAGSGATQEPEVVLLTADDVLRWKGLKVGRTILGAKRGTLQLTDRRLLFRSGEESLCVSLQDLLHFEVVKRRVSSYLSIRFEDAQGEPAAYAFMGHVSLPGGQAWEDEIARALRER